MVENIEKEQMFSKLISTGWALVLLPIVVRLLKYCSPNVNVASNIEGMFYFIILPILWIMWICTIKKYFHETFIKIKQNKIIWIVLLCIFILISQYLGFIFAIMIILKSLVLSPLLLIKKFNGTKKEQNKLKQQGFVGLVVFIIEIIALLLTFHTMSNYSKFFNNCVNELINQGQQIEVATKYCECMFDNRDYEFCIQKAIN